MNRLFALALATLIAVPALASAQTRIDNRQARQEQRIDQGVKSGELTKRETARLNRGDQKIDRMENRAQADGTVSRTEKRHIEKAQDVQSKRIYRQKHDAQARPRARGARVG
jgi:hypothetical protein